MINVEMINVTIGQEVVVNSAYGANMPQFGYRVKKITPKGQIVVVRESDGCEIRFDKYGFEVGSASRLYKSTLSTDIDHARERVRYRGAAIEAATAINNVRMEERVLHTYNKEMFVQAIAELESKLAAAKAAVKEL
jgi:hypothetical protein